jgi:hypothetical protein
MHGYGTHKLTLFTASQINAGLNFMDKDIVVEHLNNMKVVFIALNKNLLNNCQSHDPVGV